MKVLKDKTWQYEKHGIDGEVELFHILYKSLFIKIIPFSIPAFC